VTAFLIRRFFQMIIVIFCSALACYALLTLSPGGPMSLFQQRQNDGRNRLTPEDIQRIRARFELDLYTPIRFSRWFVGFPRGPIQIGNSELFANTPIGCAVEKQELVVLPDLTMEVQTTGCETYTYLRDLEGRYTARGVFFFDFGRSWVVLRDRPVMNVIISRVPPTLILTGTATLLALMIAVPLGIYASVRQYSVFDYATTGLAFFGSSMPTFFFGIILLILFAIIPYQRGWFYFPPGSFELSKDTVVPLIGTVKAGSAFDNFWHAVLPVVTLTIISVAGWSRYIRGQMLEVLRQDYVRTARAKGLRERIVIVKHALRNALIPFITLVVGIIPGIIGGAPVTEATFSWPGLGGLFLYALGVYDYPIAMAILYILAVLVVVSTLVADLLYTVVDPRISFK